MLSDNGDDEDENEDEDEISGEEEIEVEDDFKLRTRATAASRACKLSMIRACILRSASDFTILGVKRAMKQLKVEGQTALRLSF